jgi:excisionase family DNA binding protein
MRKLKEKTMGEAVHKPLSITEAASFLGYKKSYLYNMVHHGKLTAYKPGGKILFFKQEDLERFAFRNKKTANFELAEQTAILTLFQPAIKPRTAAVYDCEIQSQIRIFPDEQQAGPRPRLVMGCKRPLGLFFIIAGSMGSTPAGSIQSECRQPGSYGNGFERTDRDWVRSERAGGKQTPRYPVYGL